MEWLRFAGNQTQPFMRLFSARARLFGVTIGSRNCNECDSFYPPRSGRVVEIYSMYEPNERRVTELVVQLDQQRATNELALEQARVLASLGRSLSSAHTASAAAQAIGEAAAQLLGWDACSLSLYSGEADRTERLLTIETVDNRPVEVSGTQARKRPTERARRVSTNGEPFILREEPVSGVRPLPLGDQGKPSGSSLAAPIHHGPQTVGILKIQSNANDAYTPDAANTLQVLADYCGGALDRIRAETELRESEERFREDITESKLATERKRSQEDLSESERRLATFMENVPGFAWMKDRRDRYVFLSPATARISSHPEDWRGKTDDDLWPGKAAEEYKANDRKVVATGRALQTIESIMRDGKQGYVLVNKFPILDRSGAVAFVGGIGVDITDRKLAEEQIQASKEQLRALAARLQGARDEESSRISREIHDVLGQDLTSLNIDLVWLLDKLRAIPDRSLRAQVRQRVKGMELLLGGTVKSVQRLASDLRPGMLDDLGLSSTLEWQAEDFTRRTGIRCRWKRRPDAVKLSQEDATALFRIFQEALTNVARHAGARKVTLNLERDSGCVILQVADNGRGFDESKLLSPDSLGLLGMRERALLVGAGLEIRSAPGKGTTVTVVLPVAAATNRDGSKKSKRKRRRENLNRR